MQTKTQPPPPTPTMTPPLTASIIQVEVGQAAAVRAIAHACAPGERVYAELMQNARRAGATSVAFRVTEHLGEGCTVVASDDGTGIGDMQSLLTLGESGWDQEIIDREGPYGTGFVSALLAATRITVESLGAAFTADTDGLLSAKQVALREADADADGIVGTRITLEGVKGKAGQIVSAIKRFSAGFPIPVIVNGEVVDRPHADNDTFVDTLIGRVFVQGIHGVDAENMNPVMFLNPTLYLLGVQVNKTPLSDSPCVIHLDPKHFKAYWPVQDVLIDSNAAMIRISAALRLMLRSCLNDLHAALGEDAFASRFRKEWGGMFPELFDAIVL